jgi:predicted DNA-binding protein with PD1-like motif
MLDAMRITQGGTDLGHALVWLTRAEAAELLSVAEALVRHFDEPGYHAHVCSADDQVELTFAPEVASP